MPRELDSIADDIDKYLKHALAITVAISNLAFGQNAQCKAFCFGQRMSGGLQRLKDFIDVIFIDIQLKSAGFNLREVEHVIDQSQEVLTVDLKLFQRPTQAFIEVSVNSI